MMYLLAAIVTLSLSHTTNAACCLPYKSYLISGSGLQAQMYHVTPLLFALDNFMIAYDIKSERAVLNMTIANVLNGEKIIETIYIDNKKVTVSIKL